MCSRATATRLSLGPAGDGGYYLIGARRVPDVFTGIEWGSDQVFARTVEAAAVAGFRVHQLPVLSDVDTLDDLRAAVASGRALRTAAWARTHTCRTYYAQPRVAVVRLSRTSVRIRASDLASPYGWAGTRIVAAFRTSGLMLWTWCMATTPAKTPPARSRSS